MWRLKDKNYYFFLSFAKEMEGFPFKTTEREDEKWSKSIFLYKAFFSKCVNITTFLLKKISMIIMKMEGKNNTRLST